MLKRFVFLAILIGLLSFTAKAQTPLLQALIDATPECGTLTLPADVVYSGNHVIRKCINIESHGLRVVRNATGEFLVGAAVVTPNAAPALYVEPGVKGVRVNGIEFTALGFVHDIVVIGAQGAAQDTAGEAPADIVLDRLWIHGEDKWDSQNGLVANGANVSLTNSRIDKIHFVGIESHGIIVWNGPGPFFFFNNFIEAAGINILFGGAVPSIPGLIPTGIEIRGNHLFKPLSWKVGDPSYAGIHWGVKNLFELKTGRNVVIDGNILENCWRDSQIGYAVLFTVRGEESKAPWATIENVTFTNNLVKNSEQGFQLLGLDDGGASVRASGLLIHNNLFDIKDRFLTLSGYYNVTLSHNTHTQDGNIMAFYGEPSLGFTYVNNATAKTGGFGIKGDSAEEGSATLNLWAPAHDVRGNVIAGALARLYPPNNFFPGNLDDLLSFRGTDGLVPGYLPELGGQEPNPTPSPSPSPSPSPEPTPAATPSANNTRVPPSNRIVDGQGNVWTLDGIKMLRNGQETGGYGSEILWCNQEIYGKGEDLNYWKWSGLGWGYFGPDPCASPTPSPTPVPSPTPSPTPTPSPSPSPEPTPSPSPSPSPTPRCLKLHPKTKQCQKWSL